MRKNRNGYVSAAAFAATAVTGTFANAEVKLGFLSDMTGAASVQTGESARIAVEMAIEDFGGEVNGEKIELLVADHLNKADVGLSIAREWIETEGVDALISLDNSSVALAVSPLAAENNVVTFMSGASAELTNESCQPMQVQMVIDTYGLTRALTLPLLEAGHDNWFFITVDYAFGHDMEKESISAIETASGKVVGAVRHSPQATDYAAFLLEAQSKGAQTIGLATFGAYTIAIMKQAKEFGVELDKVPYFFEITDVKAIGLDSAQNVTGAIAFYWNQNDKSRAFTERFMARYDRPPTSNNLMNYEVTMHYLKAAAAAGSNDPVKVNEKMREMPIEMVNGDTAFIREDGRLARPMYIYRTKSLEESSGEWDYFEIIQTADAESLLLPLEESRCALVK